MKEKQLYAMNFFTSWLLKVLFNYRTGHITITSTLNLILQNVVVNSETKCHEVGISFLLVTIKRIILVVKRDL